MHKSNNRKNINKHLERKAFLASKTRPATKREGTTPEKKNALKGVSHGKLRRNI